jgi:hypothetical protein
MPIDAIGADVGLRSARLVKIDQPMFGPLSRIVIFAFIASGAAV